MHTITKPAARKPETVSRRVLRIVLPFAPSASGGLLGAVRILTPKPYATDDYYYVSIDGNQAAFMKDGGDKSGHTVDRDMRCCDCVAYGYRRTCRHLDALAALEAKGLV